MMRGLQRAVRRAGLPVATSQGFNPRPRIAILQARGVGVSSEGELVEMDFEDWVGPQEVKRALTAVLPDGIELANVVLGNPRTHASVSNLTYRVDFAGGVSFSSEAIERLLDGSEILVERRRKGKIKTVNVRPVVDDVRVTHDSVIMTFKVTQQGSARPEEILEALGMSRKDILSRCSITRTEMNLT